jgi:hypothetical protein
MATEDSSSTGRKRAVHRCMPISAAISSRQSACFQLLSLRSQSSIVEIGKRRCPPTSRPSSNGRGTTRPRRVVLRSSSDPVLDVLAIRAHVLSTMSHRPSTARRGSVGKKGTFALRVGDCRARLLRTLDRHVLSRHSDHRPDSNLKAELWQSQDFR